MVAAGAIEKRIQGVDEFEGYEYEKLVSWVIVGGELGHNARPCCPDWIGSIVQQCGATGIPVYVKQMGKVWAKESSTHCIDNKGSNPEFWTENLRLREFPF